MKLKRGFTLIELLIVVGIIAILTSIVLSRSDQAKAKARDTRRVSDIGQLQTALEAYFEGETNLTQDTPAGNAYPATLEGLVTKGYMSVLPKDPADATKDYGYKIVPVSVDENTYCLGTTFELPNALTTQSPACETTFDATYNYRVKR